MRVECESCHELVVASFAIVDGAMVATCSACHATMRASAAAAPAPVPAAAPRSSCPKCGTPRSGAVACPSCGLATERMDAYKETRDAAVPEVVRTAWQRVIDGWNEPQRHDQLLRIVSQFSCYAWVAGRYRDEKQAREGDTIADTQLDRVRRTAEIALLATASARPVKTKKPYHAMIAIVLALFVVVAAGLVYVAIRSSSSPQGPTVSQPPHP